MVSLLGLGLVLGNNVVGVNPNTGLIGKALEQGRSFMDMLKIEDLPTNWRVGIVVAAVAVVAILWAVWNSKRESAEMKALDEELSQAAEAGQEK